LAHAALIGTVDAGTVQPIVSKLFETLVVVALLGSWFLVARTAEGVMRDNDSAVAAAAASAPAPTRVAAAAASAPQ
jgi:hypothetical protein